MLSMRQQHKPFLSMLRHLWPLILLGKRWVMHVRLHDM